jgi:hypothetical protein
VAATFDGITAKLYVNGSLQGSSSFADGINKTLFKSTLRVAIGRRFLINNQIDSNTQAFNGTIDEVRIYNRALTAPTQDKNGDGVINCTDEPETEICKLFLSKTSLEDLRFTDREGNLLPYYHESDNRIWIKTSIPANSTKVIYMYYGNNQAGTLSNFNEVFPGLVAYYTFDEGSGDKAYDITPNNNHGTLYNGPTWVDGKIGKALSFDGVDDYVKVSRFSPNATWDKITIGVWSYRTSETGYQPIIFGFSTATTPGQLGWGLTSRSDWGNIPFVFLWTTDGYFQTRAGYTSTNAWTHTVVVYNTTHLSSYTNGVLQKNITTTGRVLSDDDIYIGRSSGAVAGAGTSYFNGLIDEVRIYNRALSEEEIKQLASEIPPVFVGLEE